MRAGVLSWIKPGERFRSSLGSVVTLSIAAVAYKLAQVLNSNLISEWLYWRKIKWEKVACRNANRALRDTNAMKITVLLRHLTLWEPVYDIFVLGSIAMLPVCFFAWHLSGQGAVWKAVLGKPCTLEKNFVHIKCSADHLVSDELNQKKFPHCLDCILGENWDGSTVFLLGRFTALIQSSAKSSNLQSMLLDLFSSNLWSFK